MDSPKSSIILLMIGLIQATVLPQSENNETKASDINNKECDENSIPLFGSLDHIRSFEGTVGLLLIVGITNS
jgi:hypothetical protein